MEAHFTPMEEKTKQRKTTPLETNVNRRRGWKWTRETRARVDGGKQQQTDTHLHKLEEKKKRKQNISSC